MTKPDITGQTFGRLTVLGKSDRMIRGTYAWELLCSCGKTVLLTRSSFDRAHGAQKSCGCLQQERSYASGRPAIDITGQAFGLLTAIEMTAERDRWGSPIWRLQCECGRSALMSRSRLQKPWRLNCGSMVHGPGLHYPMMPQPMPEAVGAIVAKYLRYTQPRSLKYSAAEQDERVDRLLRAAWIIVYRRSQGEEISEEHERRMIFKALRFVRSMVRLRRFVELGGVCRYTFERYKRTPIGSKMTDPTSFNEAVANAQKAEAETQPEVMHSTRRHGFKRC